MRRSWGEEVSAVRYKVRKWVCLGEGVRGEAVGSRAVQLGQVVRKGARRGVARAVQLSVGTMRRSCVW